MVLIIPGTAIIESKIVIPMGSGEGTVECAILQSVSNDALDSGNMIYLELSLESWDSSGDGETFALAHVEVSDDEGEGAIR